MSLTRHDWRAFLHGIWREQLPPLQLDVAAWERLAPILLETRAAPLVWRRLKHSTLADHALAAPFAERHRHEWMLARVRIAQLETLLQTLRAADIEAIPVKGWLHARLYADAGLRPAGDIDLCVQTRDFAAAIAALKASGGQSLRDENLNRVQNKRLREEKFWFPDAPLGWCAVELHAELTDLHAPTEPKWEKLLERGETVRIGATETRVLRPEDELRLAAIHLWRSEAGRPLWLCDLGAMLEARGPNWSWEKCLGRDRVRASWVASALLLARELTGVSLEGAPFEHQKLPRWLVPHVIEQWQSGDSPTETGEVMWHYFSSPGRLWQERAEFARELAIRWPAPIFAAIGCRRPLDNSPRWSWQMRYCAKLSGEFLAHLPRFMRQSRKQTR